MSPAWLVAAGGVAGLLDAAAGAAGSAGAYLPLGYCRSYSSLATGQSLFRWQATVYTVDYWDNEYILESAQAQGTAQFLGVDEHTRQLLETIPLYETFVRPSLPILKWCSSAL